MAHYLLDTNILLGLADLGGVERVKTDQTVLHLIERGHTCYLTAQVLIEFWSVATRPLEANGLGLDVATCDREVGRLLQLFSFLDEPPSIFNSWHRLVIEHNVSGRRVHDIRLLALMQDQKITHLLTLNSRDFPKVPGITVVEPSEV
jgi:predicted nucleic acid-binding protein